MTANQVQIRRDTASAINGQTPADGEPAWDQTNDRLRMGDGSTSGGLLLTMAKDTQSGTFIYAAAGGTANALTVTLSPGSTGLAAGMGIRVKIASNNTGAATINVDSHGAVNIKKLSSGSIAALEADDLVANYIYDMVYDGTQFLIIGGTGGSDGLASVSQGDLNTSTGSVSGTGSGTNLTLPGGSYGFYPQIKTGATGAGRTLNVEIVEDDTGTPTSYAAQIYLQWSDASYSTAYAQQRYVTSSPPFDLGDGECGGFIFALLESDGSVKNTYIADVPPWAYNGPTDIRAKYVDPNSRKKYRRIVKKRTLEEFMSGAPLEKEFQEITQQIKNADMDIIPHPFGNIAPEQKVVMLDPLDDRIFKLIELQNEGEDDLAEAIHSGKIGIDNDLLDGRKGPSSVLQARMTFKYTRKS